MNEKIRVGLLFGGESPEHDISIRSAQTVASLLDSEKFEIFPIGITRNGKWLVPNETFENWQENAEKKLHAVLDQGSPLADWSSLSQKIDVIFPCLHGPHGEDGTVQGMCELLHLPYAGCGVLASALGMDKSAQKRIFSHQRLPVLESYSFETWQWEMLRENLMADLRKRFSYPLFVKPCRQGSSIGVSRAENEEELKQCIAHAFQYDTKIIVERGLPQAREFEVAVMGNALPEVSIVGETMPDNTFFDFEAKYVKPSGKKIPAEIPQKIAEQMRLWGGMAYLALDCKGFARVDFLATQDLSEIYIGEINTIPGFTPTSTFLKLWEAMGKKPNEVLEKIIQMALELHSAKPPLASGKPFAPKLV
jgi:D-alanine-D-alanine ligase